MLLSNTQNLRETKFALSQGTSEVQEKTRSKKYQRYKHQSYTTINRVLGQAHCTKNDSHALKKVLKVTI
jgi:hypothetical protein